MTQHPPSSTGWPIGGWHLGANLYVGAGSECSRSKQSDRAIVHAEARCHRSAVGYSLSLPTSHPHHVVFRDGVHLYLNMVDAVTPDFELELFTSASAFIAEHQPAREVVVHCSVAQSRSPSLCLVFLAASGELPSRSYEEASEEFRHRYPYYGPGAGLRDYLPAQWGILINAARDVISA